MKYKAECPWCGKTVMLEVTYSSPTTRQLKGKCQCGALLQLVAFPKEVVE